MDKKLLTQAFLKFFSGLILVGLLLFLPAGTWDFWRAWLLAGVLFVPMFLAGLVMMVRAPELLRRRLNAKEEQDEQKWVIALSGCMFIAAFLLAGLARRFGWPTLPAWVSWAAAAVFLFGYGLFAEVLRENAYLSRTVEVQEGQELVSTGLYGVVRHPMYMSTLLLFFSMPLILGSLPSFLVMLLYLPIIAKRIRNEEEVLSAGLPGYEAYKQKVRYRLIPGIW